MSKALRKTIATRSRLENIVHRKCTEGIRERFRNKKIIAVDCIKRKERNIIEI